MRLLFVLPLFFVSHAFSFDPGESHLKNARIPAGGGSHWRARMTRGLRGGGLGPSKLDRSRGSSRASRQKKITFSKPPENRYLFSEAGLHEAMAAAENFGELVEPTREMLRVGNFLVERMNFAKDNESALLRDELWGNAEILERLHGGELAEAELGEVASLRDVVPAGQGYSFDGQVKWGWMYLMLGFVISLAKEGHSGLGVSARVMASQTLLHHFLCDHTVVPLPEDVSEEGAVPEEYCDEWGMYSYVAQLKDVSGIDECLAYTRSLADVNVTMLGQLLSVKVHRNSSGTFVEEPFYSSDLLWNSDKLLQSVVRCYHDLTQNAGAECGNKDLFRRYQYSCCELYTDIDVIKEGV